jgi:5-methylcytosine-specific restriction endonuclease McrA
MEEFDCPTCGETFDSRRGLGVHHSRLHDEQLPNRECGRCGSQFYSDYEKKYCSSECRDQAVSFVGSENPNYDGGKETTDCVVCNSEFEFYPSEKPGLYCPMCVENESWRDPPTLEGEQHPQWNGGKLELDCAVCGSTIERYPSHVTGDVTLCGNECRHDWLSEEFTGDGHPNWKGGDTGNYGPGWNRVRREALERDGYECVNCGKTKADIGRNPDVHHIVPVRVFATVDGSDKTDAHRLDNVVSLCLECHRKADFGHLSKGTLWEKLDIASGDRPHAVAPNS